MSTLIFFMHIGLCFALICLVLLQHGKGADAGAIMGGGADAFLGAGSAGNILSKMTTYVAIAFMVTSLLLVGLAGNAMTVSTTKDSIDVMDGSVVQQMGMANQEVQKENSDPKEK